MLTGPSRLARIRRIYRRDKAKRTRRLGRVRSASIELVLDPLRSLASDSFAAPKITSFPNNEYWRRRAVEETHFPAR